MCHVMHTHYNAITSTYDISWPIPFLSGYAQSFHTYVESHEVKPSSTPINKHQNVIISQNVCYQPQFGSRLLPVSWIHYNIIPINVI